MFKASIALVLVAFAALAYGWIAGNDAILYASIGASALAGLALLRSSMAEKRAASEPARPPAKERLDRPVRAAKSRERDVSRDFPPAGGPPKRGRDRLRSSELDTEDETEFFESGAEPVKPFRPPSERQAPRRAPAGAAWARPEEVSEFQAEYEESSYEADFEDQGYLDDEGFAAQQAPYKKQSAEAADDFRSRLAAVLGSTGEQAPAAAPASERRRSRQVAPPPDQEAPPPPRRGRRKSAQPVVAEETEQEPGGEPEPDWIRIDDVPRIRRATQPGGGFSRPDGPEEMTPYRPRRPGVPKPAEPEPSESPAPARRRTSPAERTQASKAKPAGSKRAPAGAKPSVTRVAGESRSRAPKEPDPDAPRPRRGRPPKPKP